eukprot:173070_1
MKRASLIQKEVTWTRKELQSTIAQHGITHGIIHKSRNQNKGKFCQQTIKKFQNILITLRSMLDDMRQHSNRSKEQFTQQYVPIPSDDTMVNVSTSKSNNTNHDHHTFTVRQLNGKWIGLTTQKQKVVQKAHRLEESIVEYQKELQEKNDLILKFESRERDTLNMMHQLKDTIRKQNDIIQNSRVILNEHIRIIDALQRKVNQCISYNQITMSAQNNAYTSQHRKLFALLLNVCKSHSNADHVVNPITLYCLRMFMASNLTINNLLFILEAEEWKITTRRKFKSLYNKYCDERSPAQINLNADMFQRISDVAIADHEAPLQETVFDEAITETWALMELNIYKQFLRSDYCKFYCHMKQNDPVTLNQLQLSVPEDEEMQCQKDVIRSSEKTFPAYFATER